MEGIFTEVVGSNSSKHYLSREPRGGREAPPLDQDSYVPYWSKDLDSERA